MGAKQTHNTATMTLNTLPSPHLELNRLLNIFIPLLNNCQTLYAQPTHIRHLAVLSSSIFPV
jgi:hypothetical protein